MPASQNHETVELSRKDVLLRMKELRKQNNQTLSHVAQMLGLSISGLSKFENDALAPTDETVEKLTAYYKYLGSGNTFLRTGLHRTPLSNKIFELRLISGTYLKYAAAGIGISESELEAYESGQWKPDRRTVRKMEEYHDYPLTKECSGGADHANKLV